MRHNRGSIAVVVVAVVFVIILGIGGVMVWKSTTVLDQASTRGPSQGDTLVVPGAADDGYNVSDDDMTDVILEELETSVLEDIAGDIAALEAELANF